MPESTTQENRQVAGAAFNHKLYVWWEDPEGNGGFLLPADECMFVEMTPTEAELVLEGDEYPPEKLMRPVVRKGV